MSGTYDIYCDQGATFRRVITWKDSDGDPVDLSGYVARMMVRTAYGASSPTISLSSSVSGITLSPTAGQITIEITADATSGITMPSAGGVTDAWDGVYDLEMVAPTGDVTRLLEGRFIVSPEATR